ncbi:hypothetical protein Sjap_022145 [Stephania japonica]|uniref:Secreted protein n=1 Tax=Stephania japonica TaxID=461633 RepID=A0AAP0EU10_9MAGN
MHFLLVALHVVYVLNTPKPVESNDKTVEQIKKRQKWDTNDQVCKGHILNTMKDSMFDLYYNVHSTRNCGRNWS